MNKKNTLIGFAPDVKKRLSILAAEKGLPFKIYCEGVLEMHAYDNKVPNSNFIEAAVIEVDLSSDKPATIRNLETGEKKELPKKETPKMKVDTGEPAEKKPEKKPEGKFDRIDSNLFFNGEKFMARKYVDKKFQEKYFDKEEDARKYLKE